MEINKTRNGLSAKTGIFRAVGKQTKMIKLQFNKYRIYTYYNHFFLNNKYAKNNYIVSRYYR